MKAESTLSGIKALTLGFIGGTQGVIESIAISSYGNALSQVIDILKETAKQEELVETANFYLLLLGVFLAFIAFIVLPILGYIIPAYGIGRFLGALFSLMLLFRTPIFSMYFDVILAEIGSITLTFLASLVKMFQPGKEETYYW